MPAESYRPGICKCLSNGLINEMKERVARREASSHASLHLVGARVSLIHVYFILLFFSDAQEGGTEMDRLLVRARFRGRTLVAGPRGLYARRGPRATVDHHGVLLHEHLLGDLARYEAPVSHDVTTRVSPEISLFIFFLAHEFPS